MYAKILLKCVLMIQCHRLGRPCMTWGQILCDVAQQANKVFTEQFVKCDQSIPHTVPNPTGWNFSLLDVGMTS